MCVNLPLHPWLPGPHREPGAPGGPRWRAREKQRRKTQCRPKRLAYCLILNVGGGHLFSYTGHCVFIWTDIHQATREGSRIKYKDEGIQKRFLSPTAPMTYSTCMMLWSPRRSYSGGSSGVLELPSQPRHWFSTVNKHDVLLTMIA